MSLRWHLPRSPHGSPRETGQRQLLGLGASTPASAAPALQKAHLSALIPTGHDARASVLPGKAFQPLRFGREAQRRQNNKPCVTEFPTERIILPALWHTQPSLTTASKVRKPQENSVPAGLMQKPSFQPTKASGSEGGRSLSQALLSPSKPFAFLPFTLFLQAGGRRRGLRPALTHLTSALVGCRPACGDITRAGPMGSTPRAGTPHPALQVRVSLLPLHAEKQPLGRSWGKLLGSSRVLQAHGNRVGKDTAPELMKAGRIFSGSPRRCCAGSQRGQAVPGLGSSLETAGQAAELGWTP